MRRSWGSALPAAVSYSSPAATSTLEPTGFTRRRPTARISWKRASTERSSLRMATTTDRSVRMTLARPSSRSRLPTAGTRCGSPTARGTAHWMRCEPTAGMRALSSSSISATGSRSTSSFRSCCRTWTMQYRGGRRRRRPSSRSKGRLRLLRSPLRSPTSLPLSWRRLPLAPSRPHPRASGPETSMLKRLRRRRRCAPRTKAVWSLGTRRRQTSAQTSAVGAVEGSRRGSAASRISGI